MNASVLRSTSRPIQKKNRSSGSRCVRFGFVVSIALLLQLMLPIVSEVVPTFSTSAFAQDTSNGVVAEETTAVIPGDTVPPVIVVPNGITATADPVTGVANVQFADQVFATDDIDGSLPVNFDIPPGEFAVGETTVTCT